MVCECLLFPFPGRTIGWPVSRAIFVLTLIYQSHFRIISSKQLDTLPNN